ncbi:MAG: PAS domain-containing protein [Alphaproteobacteria bacterium]|nr:PAS domain-containing protein [Alphaproteobacteria bacterium]MDE2631285.1 PAS domain-containing protein [Alphaproteobacteria bacterium]
MDFASVYEGAAHDDLVRFAQYCQALAGDRPMPLRRQFRPGDVRWLLGRLYVVDVIDAGKDFHFRVAGLLMKEIYGVDFEGRRLSEFPETGLSKALRANYDRIMQTKAALFQRAALCWPEHQINLQRLLVPFAGDDGALCSIVVGVHVDVPLESVVIFRGEGPGAFQPSESPSAAP